MVRACYSPAAHLMSIAFICTGSFSARSGRDRETIKRVSRL